jgi:hypothetical protein
MKSSVLVGITAPNFIWVCSLLLLVLPTIAFWALLRWQVRRAKKPLTTAAEGLKKVKIQHPPGPRRGLAAAAYEEVGRLFTQAELLRSAWEALSAVLVVRRGADDKDEYWLSESSSQALSEELLYDRQLNRNWYRAFPGILTGLGLLLTFIAILIALMDVKVGENNVVSGVGGLINGLSGKFVSSIVALFLATVFIVIEKYLLHGLSKARLELVGAVDSVFPRLSATHILAELKQDMAEQTLAFRQFNTDLSTRLKQSFSESMGPTLDRMVTAMDHISQLLRESENQKQESIVGSLQEMLEAVERSISATLHEMSGRFSDSLTGTTMAQFNNIADSLGGTANLLQNMNAQFQMTQTAMSDLVNLVKNSTVEQVALGKSQVEDLTAVLRQMMVQLSETANSSTAQMTRSLSGLMADLSSRVTELNQQMAQTLEENAKRAADAASTVINEAGAWSARNSEQLGAILEQQQAHLRNVKEVEDSLMSALGLFNDSLAQYATLNSALQKTAGEAAAMATAAAGAARSTQESQTALQQVAGYATAQAERLAEASRKQQEEWGSIHARMEQYQRLFAETERSARDLLDQITQFTNSHIDATRRRYDELLEMFNEHISSAVQKLGVSIKELEESLAQLGEVLEDLPNQLQRR